MPAIAFVIGHMSLNTLANVCFKLSAASHGAWRFILWQAIGNLSGFLGVLVYTGLLRHIPLHVAFPVTQGLAVLGVLAAARILFQETITPLQWLGTSLVVTGIILTSFKSPGA